MGIMFVFKGEPAGLEIRNQILLVEYSDVAARLIVIISRQPPAYFFRPMPRHRDSDKPAGYDNAVNFINNAQIIRDMLKHFRADHPVHAAVRERQAQGIADHDVKTLTVGRVQHRCGGKTVTGFADILIAKVQADDMTFGIVIGGMTVASFPATKVE